MENSFENIFKSVQILLEECGAFGKEFERQLNKIREIEHHIQAINQLIHDEEQSVEGQAKDVMIVLHVCNAVAYGLYIPAKAEATALTKIVNSMKIEDFPESKRPIGLEIKCYVKEIEVELQSVDNTINEIVEMMELIKKNQYIISKTERIGLKRKTLELDIGLKICTFFQKQTAKALTRLKSETSSFEKRQTKPALVKRVFAALSYPAVGALTGAFGLAKTATNGYGCPFFRSIASEYEKIVAETNKLHSALKSLQVEQNEKHRNVEEKGIK